MIGMVLGLVAWILACGPAPPARLSYPPARVDATVETLHGVAVPDPYRWMEDLQSDETRRWIGEEEALFRSFVESVPGREVDRRRILDLSSGTVALAPVKAGGRYFLTKITPTGVPAGVFVQDGPKAAEKPLVDPNPKSLGEDTTLGAAVPSPDGRLVTYTTAKGQSRWLRIRFRDAKSGAEVPVPPLATHSVAGAPVWSRDSRELYYVRFEPRSGTSEDTAPPDRPTVRRFRLADRQEAIVYEPPAEDGVLPGLAVADEGGGLVVSLRSGSDNRNRILLVDPEPGARREPVPLMPQADASYTYLGSRGARFWFFTDRDAPRGRVIALDEGRPQPENWKEIVPQAAEPVAASSAVGGNALGMFANRILLVYLKDGRPVLRIFDAEGSLLAEPPLPAGGQVWGGFSGSPDDREVFYRFLGLTHASTTYRLDLETNRTSVFSSSESGAGERDIVVEQVFYRSADGTRVPMFLAHRKGFRRDGRGPAFMYGYGAFGWVSFLWYQPFVLNWLDLGGVYALPGIRGGGEYGEDWHRAGAGRAKSKAIDDYIAAAEWLVANRYTSRARLVANGGSASGGVAAAAVLQRPDLFGAAIIDRPVLDMLRFDRFSQAAYWLPEFGTPRVREDFDALRAWSPYHAVRKGACYPPVVVMAGEKDQVAVPLHAYKFVAALQAAQGCANPVLLQVVRGTGHSFGTTPEQTAQTWADETAFLRRVLSLGYP